MRKTLAELIFHLVRIIPQNYNHVAAVLELVVLNTLEPKLRKVTFHQTTTSTRLTTCHQIDVYFQHRDTLYIWLMEVKCLSIILMQTGFDIEEIPRPLEKSMEMPNECDQINSLWEQYSKNRSNSSPSLRNAANYQTLNLPCHKVQTDATWSSNTYG